MAEGKVLGEDLHDVGVDVGILGSEVGVDRISGWGGAKKKKIQLSTRRGQHESMRLHPGVKAVNKQTAR